jgi:trimeric autotransporter adhesin
MCTSERKYSLPSAVFVLLLLTFASGCSGFFVNPTLSSLAIGPSNQTITVNPRVSVQMSATGTYSDGSTKDLTGKVAWSSSDPTCATVSATGLVSPVSSVTGICTASIVAASGTVTAAGATVTVTEGTPTSVTLTVSNSNPPANSTVTFTAKALFPGSSTPQDITASVTWNNSDTTDLTLTQGGGTGTIASGATGKQITVSATFDNVTSNAVTLTVQ